MKRIALLGCLALLGSQAACKKAEKKAEKTPETETAGKTTEPTPPTPTQPEKPKLDTPEDKVAFYKACYGHLNAKDWDKMATCYTDSVTSEHLDSGMPAASGKQGVVDNMKMFTTAFPDLNATPTLILVNGNKIASADVVTGTNSGPMTTPSGEMPATNKKVGMMQFHMVEIDPAAGGASKEWIISDMGTFMGQLGLHKMPVRAVMEKPTGEAQVVIAKDDDAEKANLEAYKKATELWAKKDAKGVMAMWDDKAVIHDYGMPQDTDKKKSAAMMAEIQKAFPDAKAEPVDTWAAGEYVVAVMKNTGTNKGPMPSMKLKKPTNKPVSFTGADIVKMTNGKAVEAWSFYNGAAIAQQLGLMPAPGAAPAGGDKGAAPAGGDQGAAPAKGEKKPAKGATEEKPADQGATP